MKRILVCLMLLSMPAIGSEKLHDSSVLLWTEGAPQAKGEKITDQPALTIHLPDNPTGAAVVVCPGGGFTKLASDNEGLHVARWLNSIGVTAFVLRYRLRPDYDSPVALLDVQRAIRYVRHNTNKLDIDPGRIGVLGFSAGGYLASSAAIRHDPGNPDATDPIDRVSSRPDFAVPIYPVIDEELPALVTPASPPVFLALTHEDLAPRIKGTLPFYEALLDNDVPAEMHVFARGKHGAGLAPGDPSLGQWPVLLARWLRNSGLLTEKQRVPLKGTVTVDGEPLLWGGIAFIPQDPNAPHTWMFAGGQFSIDRANGPVPGPHSVEVHILSRDMSDMQSGQYSMPGPERYTKVSPEAEVALTVEIGSGEELSISITTK